MAECLSNLDAPVLPSTQPLDNPLQVSGWFFDGHGQPAKKVMVACGNQTVVCTATERPDVAEHFKSRGPVASATGFTARMPLLPGEQILIVTAETISGESVLIAEGSVQLLPLPVSSDSAETEHLIQAHAPDIPAPRLPAAPEVVVSVLFYFREDLIFRCLDALLPQLLHTTETTSSRITLICILNYPAPTDLPARIEARARQAGLPTSRVKLVLDQPGHNHGFGAGHNRAFGLHPSDLFVMVNSDVRMEQADWLTAIIRLFSSESVALAGLAATAAKLRSDGCGIDAPDPRQKGFDFVDGSLLAVNSASARRLGLFIDSYQFFYFEDADLCLRYRQAGQIPALLDLAYHHDRFSSTRLMPRPLIEGVLDHNRARFFEAWSPFLKFRRLRTRLLVCLPAQDCIRQCAALPALFGLLRDHPAALVEVAGVHPTLRSLFGHPQILLRASAPVDPQHHYHKVCRADGQLPAHLPLVEAIAAECGTDPDLPAARAHLLQLASIETVSATARRTLIVVPRTPPYFQGLRPALDVMSEIVTAAGQAGPVSLYTELPLHERPASWPSAVMLNGVSLPELLRELFAHPVVVSSDHWVLQLAQLAGAPCFAWMGAISPRTRIWDWSRCGAFTAPEIACIGCNHTLGTAEENTCIRADVACMDRRWLASFLEQLRSFQKRPEAPDWLRHAWTPAALSTRRAPSPEMDLSRWRNTMVENVLVLIPIKPGLPDPIRQRCRELAERAVGHLPRSRIILDDRENAPPRGTHPHRQAALASIRQGMIERHLQDADWVFWVDADIVDYSADLVVELIHRSEGGIAAPFVIMEGKPGSLTNSHGFGPGRFFDVAGFVEEGRWASFSKPHFRQPGPACELDSVGSCYVVPADLYRRGARHEADALAQAFVASGRDWPEDAVQLGQSGQPLAFTEHYSVCAFARAQGLPVRAHADLIVLHERVG